MHIAYQIDQGAPHNKLYLMWVCELLTDQQKLVDAQHLPCAGHSPWSEVGNIKEICECINLW